MIWIILSAALLIGYASCGTEYTLELSPTDEYASVDPLEMYLGKMVVMKTTASFAEGLTTTGVVIELLPSVPTTVFAIGDILSYTVGSELSTPDTTMDGSNFASFVTRHKGSEYEDTSLKQRFDTRAVFTIGDVISNGAGTTDADNQIIIEFEIVYVSTGGNDDGAEHNLCAGEEYDGGNYIWISMFTVTTRHGSGAETEDPTFATDTGGDTNIGFMTPKVVTVEMSIPRSASPLTFEAVVMNDTENVQGFSIQYLNLTSVGEAYSFGTVAENIYTVGYESCSSTSLMLDLGTPINKESKETTPDPSTYPLDIGITLLVENPDLVNSVVSVGLALDISGTEIWVSDIDLTVTGTSGTQPDVVFVAKGIAGEVTVSPGFVGGASIELTIPRSTNYYYALQLGTRVLSAAGNALSILAITPTTHGNNIPCSIPSSAVNVVLGETVLDSGLYEAADLYVNISNTGMQPTPVADSDVYKFDVSVMMMTTASENETFELVFSVNGGTEKHVVFTAGPEASYPDVNYNFTLENDCLSDVQLAGSTMSFKMKVETERSVTAGNMTVEAPIPNNVTLPHLKLKSATVISKGLNVVSVPLGGLNTDFFDWVENSGEQDRAVITIPMVCNVERVDDPLEDIFVIELKVTMKDDPALYDGQTVVQKEFGIGAKIGKKIWVADYTYDRKPPIGYQTTKKIDSFTLFDVAEPGDLKLQWSDDNVNYYDWQYTVGVGTTSSGDTTFDLDQPLYARYARLASSDGETCSDYTLGTSDINDDITFHGSVEAAEIMRAKVMFALDGDANTCMSLPTPNTTNATTYYWANFKTTVLGADGNSPFLLWLTGQGMNCNNTAGPQVTLAMYPKDSTTLKFKGKRKKCTFLDEIPGTPMTCKYACTCSDSITCADISLVLYYDGNPASDYELCDVKLMTY